MIYSNNKRGQGMSTNTIVLLILGLIVLVALIWGFATGWSAFKDVTGSSNVDETVADCTTQCQLNNKYSFCSASRPLKAKEDNLEVKTSCAVMANEKTFTKYGIQDCPQIDCKKPCEDILIGNNKGKVAPESAKGKYDVTELANNLEAGQRCFIN